MADPSREAATAPDEALAAARETWPAGVSNGLTLPCRRCGVVPHFDFGVDSTLWHEVVPADWRRDVVCLPCLDAIATEQGRDVAAALRFVQFTGIGKTVLLGPAYTHYYLAAALGSVPAPEPAPPSEDEPTSETLPLMDILAIVRTVARSYGYAIAVHGSLSRDVDLVAIPWGEVTASADELVREIVKAGRWLLADEKPTVRHHGRLCWTIRWPCATPGYLDFSVMPTTRSYEDLLAVPVGEPQPLGDGPRGEEVERIVWLTILELTEGKGHEDVQGIIARVHARLGRKGEG